LNFRFSFFCQLFFQILTKSFLIAAFDGWQEIWIFLWMSTNWVILSLDFDFFAVGNFEGLEMGFYTDELD
jgi:hypothetical protein